MSIESIAIKYLQGLQNYVDAINAEKNLFLDLQLLPDEKVIGFYINQIPDQSFIAITNQKMIVCNHNQYTNIEYFNIESCETESSKIFVKQKSNVINILYIDGIKQAKFLDIYGFLKFVKKVLVNIKLNSSPS